MPISTRQGKSFPGDTFTDENRRFKSTDLVHPNHSKAFDHAVRMISLKRGMVDAIIFEKQSNGKSQFLVYLARRIGKSISPACMTRGSKGFAICPSSHADSSDYP